MIRFHFVVAFLDLYLLHLLVLIIDFLLFRSEWQSVIALQIVRRLISELLHLPLDASSLRSDPLEHGMECLDGFSH